MIRITGLPDAIARLAQYDVPAATTRGTQAAAAHIADAVTQSLSHPPGSNPEFPARRTGALRASIGHVADGNGAVIFSDSPVAIHQELGTARLAPRPFLAPAATQHADSAAWVIADAISTDIAS